MAHYARRLDIPSVDRGICFGVALYWQLEKRLFLAPEEDSTSGMVSMIMENRPYEFISIEHLGEVRGGKEDTTSEKVKAWRGAHENYTFKEEKNGQTELWWIWTLLKSMRRCLNKSGQRRSSD
jgi:hypothetical protein